MSELLAEGTGKDIDEAGFAEAYFRDGDTGEVIVKFASPVPPEELAEMQENLIQQGVTLTAPITQRGSTVTIRFRKEDYPNGGITLGPLVIPLIIAGVATAALITGGVIVWQVLDTTKEIIQAIPSIVWWVGGAALAFILFKSVRKELPAKYQKK